jgi:tetratricopeptide (TPR) repeat protein
MKKPPRALALVRRKRRPRGALHPANGQQVIETPATPRRSAAAGAAPPTQRACGAPNDLALATTLAQALHRAGPQRDRSALFGYAQAALAPWWWLPAPPQQVRLLRATLLQSTHQFPEALADLKAVLAADPANAQAWLTRATVQTVRGDYAGRHRQLRAPVEPVDRTGHRDLHRQRRRDDRPRARANSCWPDAGAQRQRAGRRCRCGR